MKTGKDIILEYCRTVESHSIELLEACQDIESGLTKKLDWDTQYYNYLDGHCPSIAVNDDETFELECYKDDNKKRNEFDQIEICKLLFNSN